MPVPVLKQGDYLIASIQTALTDIDLMGLRDDLLRRVGQHRSRGVIVDLTALDVLDSFASRTLNDMGRMLRLKGAETVVVGVQPEVAIAMVRLGLTLQGVSTALDLEDGMVLLGERARRGARRER